MSDDLRPEPDDPRGPADPGSGAHAEGTAGSARPRDEHLCELGQLLILRLLSAIRVGRAYQVGNQTFRAQLDLLMETLGPALESAGELVLVALETDLYLNGVRIRMTRNSLRHHQSALKEFSRRKIAGLRVDRGVTRDELEKFFGLFLQPEIYNSTGLLEAALAQGCDHIQPAIYASTEAPSDDDVVFHFGSPGEASDPWTPPSNREGGEAFGGASGATGSAAPGAAPRGAAPKNYHLAMAGARSLLTPTVLQDGMEMRHAKRVVQPLVDGAFANDPVVMGLATLGHHDEYTYMHAVNVCMVAVTMGRMLGLDRRALADLGVAALLHDVGKGAVADKVRHPIEAWTETDRAAAERHPIEGARLLARSTMLNETTLRCLRVALEHHAGPGGYPALGGRTPSVLSRIVGCADAYVSLQTHRSERGRTVTPCEALGMMLGPLAGRFDPALRWALVQSIGFYPPGQMVKLDDDAVALVLAPNASDLARPHLRIVIDALGDRSDPRHPIEFRPLPPERSVARPLRAPEYPDFLTDRSAA